MLQPERDLFTSVLDGTLRLILKLLRYLGLRLVQNPLVGLGYLTIALPAAFLIVQDVRQVLAAAVTVGTSPFATPSPMWPLTEPLPVGALLSLFLVIGLVIAFDRWALARRSVREREAARPKPISTDEWVLGRAYNRVWNPDPGEFKLEPTNEIYKLTEEHLRTHMIVVAPTGSGKTRSVLEPALHLFKRIGAAAIYLDAKGNDFDPGQFHLNFDLDNPSSSARLNVWSGRTPREMGERLGEALVPDAGASKAYFVNNAKDTIAALVEAHHTAYEKMPSLKQLLTYLRSADSREDLAQALRSKGLPEESDELVDLQRLHQLAEQKNDVLGGLDTALAPLARGDVTALLATDGQGYSIEQLVAQPVRARFALSVGDHPRIAPIIGRLVLAQFTYVVISPDCNKAILKAIVVDEARHFVTPALASGMAMARENRGCYVLAFQNLSQIGDPTLREDILSVAGNKLVMAGVGDQEAEKFSRLFGSQEQPYIAHSQNTSQGTNNSRSRGSGREGGDLLGSAVGGMRHQTGMVRSSSVHRSEGASSRLRERAHFLPSEIRNLPQFHVLIERRDSRGEVTPATIVDMDMELTRSIRDAQALKLYAKVGRLEAVLPELTRLQPAGRSRQPGSHASKYPREVGGLDTGPQGAVLTTTSTARTADMNDGNHVGVKPSQEADAEPHGADADSNLHAVDGSGSTRETRRDYPDWVEATAHNITRLLKISKQQAMELAIVAYRNGRDAAYVTDNLEHVCSAPNVKNATSLFTYLIRANQHKLRSTMGPRAEDTNDGNGSARAAEEPVEVTS